MKKEISIEKLIKKISFEDIEWIEISKLIKYIQPSKYIVENKNYNVEFKTPVLTPGKSFILGYTNETNGIYNASNNNSIILFDDFTTSFHWVDFDFKVKSSALKILINNDDKISNFKFLYYSMRNIKNEVQDHTRQWISKYSKLKIRLPSIEIQAKIVDILDNFAELTAELLARKEQYHYYRNKLLSFNIFVINDSEKENTKRSNSNYYTEPVEWKSLSDISTLTRGEVMSKDYIRNNQGIYPVYSSQTSNNGIIGKINSYQFDGEYLTWTTDGAHAGTIFHRNEKFNSTNVCGLIKIKNNEVNIKYIYYYLTIVAKKYVKSGSGNPKLMNNVIGKILIPIPSIEVQTKIVNILDQFNTLCNDISKGLPAEIKARQEQYEYYRNKLLTF